MSFVKRNPGVQLRIAPSTNQNKMQKEEHSIFGASGAKCWRSCPGAPKFVQEQKALGNIPEEVESEFAKEGTEAHEWAKKVLRQECLMSDVPEAFVGPVGAYVDHCLELTEEHARGADWKGFQLIEERVPLFYRPQDEGTVDFAIVTNEKLIIVDYKHGQGVEVEAEQNDQCMIYAASLAFAHEEEFQFTDGTEIEIHVFQPRHFSFNGEAKIWSITWRELKDFCIDIERDYKAACDEENRVLNPSHSACQFCDAAGVCTARAKSKFDPIVDFDDESAPLLKITDFKALTSEQITFICTNGKAIKKLCDDVAAAEFKRLQAGGEPNGMKLVEGNLGNRAWVDEKAAETFLKGQLSADERYQPRKLVTAPQALKVMKCKVDELSTVAKVKLGLADEETMKKSKTECLIHRPTGNPQMVPITDKREAIEFKPPEDMFEESPDTGDDDLDSML